jgi:TonB-linked SusC/RagA family outer membrane protein
MRKLCLLLSAMFLLLLNTMAQNRSITGKVTDDKGAPLPNVSVIVRGTTTGTTTAADGTYSISVSPKAKELQFSFLGFETITVTVGSRTSITVTLNPAGTKEMGEIVVTGISRIKKSEYTGASTKLDEKQLKDQPVGSFDQILQGKVPGLTVLTGSGAPGSASTIIIRGQGSIEGGSAPLYVVDGIPIEEGAFQGLNANDFASVDVLRDAASTALYGSRGSAGVIVITTKRGVAGKMKLGYSAQMGLKSRPEFSFRPMNTKELLKAQEDYGKVVGATASSTALPGWYYSTENPRYAGLSAAQQAAEKRTYDSISSINTNWNDQIFRQGNFSNHQITLSGGTGKTRLFSALDLYNEEGITLRTDMKRVTLRTNLDYGDDKFNYAVSTSLGYTKRSFQQSTVGNSLGNPFLTSAVNVPYARVTNDDGTYATGTGSSFSAANQLDLTKYDENYNNQFKGVLSISANYKISNNITAGIISGIDFRETQNTNYGSKLAFVRLSSSSITGKAGFQTEGLDRFLTATVRPSITYKKLFKEKHDIEVLALGEYVKEMDKNFSSTGFGTDPKRPNTIAGITQGNSVNQLYAQIGGGKFQTALMSGLVTARYTYAGKYTLTGSYRQDGSSKLPKETRWQGFYSVGIVWDASKETFIKNIRAINSLRVKLSNGTSGNANNFPGGAYPYQITYDQGSYSGLNTIYASYPGNNKLKWETTTVTNLGIDFELLSRRLYGDINLYDKVTKDLFIARKLSATAGFGNGFTQNINGGKLGNKGIEVNLNADVVRKKDFVWTVFGNLGYNKNKVISLAGEPAYESGTELIKEGVALGTHYEVKWAGVDAATGQPLYYDINGNIVNVRSDKDRVQEFGTWEAPWKGGFGSSVRFKGFDISVLFSFQKGSTKVDNMEYFTENPVGFLSGGYNQSSDLHFWQNPGDIVNTPSPLYGTDFSSKIIHDASFLRLRNLTLAYSVPRTILEKTKFISNLRFYVQGANLFIWTKWRGMDPEAGAVNINLSEFPNPRTVTAGLEISF